MNRIKKTLGIFLSVIAVLIYIIGGIYGLIICLAIVRAVFGQAVAYLSLLVFPVLITLAPWYAFFAWGRYYPLVIVYGMGITATIFFFVSKWLIGDHSD